MPEKTSQAAPNKKDSPAGDAPKASVARSNFKALYPEDATITLKVEANPKKAGSKSAERFEGYFAASKKGDTSVGGALAAGVTYADIAYDVGRGFITVEGGTPYVPPEPKAKAEPKAKTESADKAA